MITIWIRARIDCTSQAYKQNVNLVFWRSNVAVWDSSVVYVKNIGRYKIGLCFVSQWMTTSRSDQWQGRSQNSFRELIATTEAYQE